MPKNVEVQEEISHLAQKAGKYLTFELGDEVYGLEILKVQEIIGMMTITRVPKTPDFVRGVINLRGKVIPVMELRQKFGLDTKEDTEKTCIIVVQVNSGGSNITMGTLVDEVSEVLDISADQLEETPSFGTNVDTNFIMGIGKVDKKVIMLLDIDKVLSATDLNVIKKVSK